MVSAQVWGTCPRCGHELDIQQTLSVPITGLRGGRGLWAGADRAGRPGGWLPVSRIPWRSAAAAGTPIPARPSRSPAAGSASACPPPRPIHPPRPDDHSGRLPGHLPRPGRARPQPGARPSAGRPRPVSAADREAFDALAKESLPAVRSMAAAWRTGLTALITLVTTGIILKGRTDTTSLALPWRIAVTVAIGAGLALAIVGLWHALAAEAGARTRLHTLDDIRAEYASVQAYQVGQAAAAGRRLQTARILVAAALGLLLTGVLLTWWAPAAPATRPPT